jgi:hypothetical protein
MTRPAISNTTGTYESCHALTSAQARRLRPGPRIGSDREPEDDIGRESCCRWLIRLAPRVCTRVQPAPAKIWDSRGPHRGFFYPISSRTAPGVVPLGLEMRAMGILSPGSARRENQPPASKVVLAHIWVRTVKVTSEPPQTGQKTGRSRPMFRRTSNVRPTGDGYIRKCRNVEVASEARKVASEARKVASEARRGRVRTRGPCGLP